MWPSPKVVIAGHSRPKDGVLKHAYVPAIPIRWARHYLPKRDGRDKLGHDRIMQFVVTLTLSFLFVAAPAVAGVLDDDNYSIMKPEPTPPGVVKPYKSPRGANKRVTVPKHPSQAERHIPRMPPPIVNQRTGQAYPNLPPPVPGSGIGGRETGQDRALRCAHQAGVYGQTGTNYLATCINQ